MEQLKAKLKKQGGFTMVELLIVVAIIAILVAVSLPMFNNALEGSRHAVDQSNVRDAIALATVEYMTTSDKTKFDGDGQKYSYKVTDTDHQGELVDGETGGVEPKCTCTGKASGGLVVTVKNGTDGMPDITTSWHFDTTNDKTVA